MKACGTALILCFLLVQGLNANVITKGVREIAEAIGKRGGKEAAQELAEFGGKQAIQEVLEKATKEGGEELAEKVIRYGRKYGLKAVKTIDNAPALYVKALDGMPETLVERALWAAQREPAAMTRLLSQYGPETLEIAAKFRGVGTDIISKLGDDGVRMAKSLTEDQAVILARHADDIAGLSLTKRNQVVGAIMATPGKVIDYIEKHPQVLRTTAGFAAFLAVKGDFVGEEIITSENEDGTTTTYKRGLIERILDRFQKPISTISIILAVIIASMGMVKIWGCYRRERVKVVLAEKKLADSSKNTEA